MMGGGDQEPGICCKKYNLEAWLQEMNMCTAVFDKQTFYSVWSYPFYNLKYKLSEITEKRAFQRKFCNCPLGS